MKRIYIGETPKNIGTEVRLDGWADTVRDHGKITFLDLRDRTGTVQCVIGSKEGKITPESVIQVQGIVKERPENARNKNLKTGAIEIEVHSYEILNRCKELPIPVQGDGYEVSEDMRLKYRYLDLRRSRLHSMLELRSQYVRALRESLWEQGFLDVTTPMLTKGTTEGSRNFIVPSRLNPGKFYALPQSPQQYKQLLMTAGVERYFQHAVCIRDEDLKIDRGFEHTQIDIEMSFVEREDVMRIVEEAVKYAVKRVGRKILSDPFPVISYEEAMKKYGGDKFDMRSEKEKKEGILAFAWVVDFPFFKKVNKEDAAEVEDSRSGWVFTHNPFSMPVEEHIAWHLAGENIEKIRTTQYDLVCNGLEVGGGSIRAHRSDILRATYKIMGYSDEEIEETVGHMIEAFDLGTPPHGGIALGVERHMMVMTGETSFKEVYPFPMSGSGKTSVTDAPSSASPDLLKELGIQVSAGETDVVFVQLKRLLDANSVSYHILEHKPVKTSEEAAEVRGTSMSMAPKAMILRKKDGTLLMACVPADQQLNLEAVSNAVGEKVKIALPDDVEEKLGVKVGAVPPFGNVFGIEMYLDGDFWKKDEVVFNAGRRDRSIRMKASDLIAVAKPNKMSKDLDLKK